MGLFQDLVQEHLDRGCTLAVAQTAARTRLEEVGLWDAVMHPRGRAGEFAEKGGGRPALHTRSGRAIRTRPYEQNREAYLRHLAASKPAKLGRREIERLKHIKNVLKDDKVPRSVRLELAAGAMGLIVGTAVPLIPGDELISAGIISHALKRSRGESAVPLAQRVGQLAEPAAKSAGMMSPGTAEVGRRSKPILHRHEHHLAGHVAKPPPARVMNKRQFKPAFAGSRF